MKFAYAILYVEDVERSIEFYERAFGFARKMIHKNEDGNAYGELETGATTLSFASRKFVHTHFPLAVYEGGIHNDPPAAEFAFVTDDVEASFRMAIGAGAIAVHRPVKKPWGQTVGYVRDNEGFVIEICSPVS